MFAGIEYTHNTDWKNEPWGGLKHSTDLLLIIIWNIMPSDNSMVVMFFSVSIMQLTGLWKLAATLLASVDGRGQDTGDGITSQLE
jgi:hypothetical protein